MGNPAAAATYRQQGQIRRLNNDLAGAVAYLQKAVALDERDHESHSMLANIFVMARDVQRAVLHAMLAVAAQPENLTYKRNFIEIAGAVPFVKYSAVAERALLDCLQTQDLDCSEAQGIWHSLLALHPEVSKIYDVRAKETPVIDLQAKELFNPFFLLGIEQVVVLKKAFENFIAAIRCKLLDSEKPDAALAAAIACYAFNTEYILDATEAELEKASALRNDVENGVVHEAGRIAVLGCYMPLASLKNVQKLAEILGEGRLARVQIKDVEELRRRRLAVEAITPIDDAISLKVQEQYEEFPYPRWSARPRARFDSEIRKSLPQGPLNILVAGCGTGQEVAQLALSLPDARILAVDLSRTSIAYASQQAGRLGIGNITFRQADILKLGVLKDRYDYITSMGVLHHMQDPLAGWRVLEELLKPRGVMYIGLYSEAGRKDIVVAREAIAKAGLGSSAADMRKFRVECHDLLPQATATMLEIRRDYYSLSMCRDLLFHVQEHRFDIPRIKSALQSLGLSFIKFDTIAQPPGRDLDAWAEFENKNPYVFNNMYRFWCKKN